MVRETFRCNTGILWDIDGLKEAGLDPDHLYPEVVVPSPLSTPINSPGGTVSASPTRLSESSPPTSPDGLPASPTSQVSTEQQRKLAEREYRDATSPVIDQLSLSPSWWFLEFLPTKGRRQLPEPEDENHWHHYFLWAFHPSYTFSPVPNKGVSVNRGRGRIIPRAKAGTHIHNSVRLRLEHMHRHGDDENGTLTAIFPPNSDGSQRGGESEIVGVEKEKGKEDNRHQDTPLTETASLPTGTGTFKDSGTLNSKSSRKLSLSLPFKKGKDKAKEAVRYKWRAVGEIQPVWWELIPSECRRVVDGVLSFRVDWGLWARYSIFLDRKLLNTSCYRQLLTRFIEKLLIISSETRKLYWIFYSAIDSNLTDMRVIYEIIGSQW
jgi:hypothetical protein